MRRLIEEFLLYCRAITNLLFPRRCLVCGRFLEDEEQYLCIGCFAEMPLTYFWDWKENPEERMLWSSVGITSAVSLFFYINSNNYSLITQMVKYRGWLTFGRMTGRCLGGKISDSHRFATIDCLVPVPLHWKREWSRGYNQSEVICEGLREVLHIPIHRLLKRTRSTNTQTKLNSEEKQHNVTGAFAINAVRLAEAKKQGVKHVLLVDDVITSGATICACASELIEYFEVSVASIAYVGEL